jgi:hypothetical protein
MLIINKDLRVKLVKEIKFNAYFYKIYKKILEYIKVLKDLLNKDLYTYNSF